ncbi:hypothetical protein C5C66_08430 [Rathayibacter toxicus]|uniref:Uncharacterized protein n=1 Tax=Rathayibacter toxicus TaxID=145458 RepID=A0A0U1PVP1_9MICO|nr:hypothetical protein APU90_08500 [Rathayibacter toxicus]KKM46993.1 hypothetical protein VT73_01720 [Rathayibacter toxicus]PPG20524.1 hypothetical protein C5D15_08425 [Rathayibacter toxicus]PPG45626.1 hypothetical protein C5D16_08395 [Rathayibacter toxicus]PPH62209.1 hypothetical protein C5D13_08490 [Rathayibacter toxicus]
MRTTANRNRVLSVTSATLVVGLLVTLSGCTAEKAPIEPTRMLQSVSVTVAPNNAVRAIDATAIAVGSDSSQTNTTKTSYDPSAVAGDLPIRVRTTYRTTDSSGTDLSVLKGYSGRVEITVAVENLTVKAQDVQYDVAGQARSQQALVGAPLTLAASTALSGVSPSQVVTTASGSDGTLTNGVLSRNESGDAVVQWASLLAPPAGGATATLTLVANVNNFTVPTFDLAVQPGLSTDPTLRGALTAAFDQDPTSQLALERRTIDVISSVNEILTRAGTTITQVRSSLDSTAATLGVRTAQELRESTASTTSSMQSLKSQLTTLQSDLSSTVSKTRSDVVQQLSQALAAVDAMLGDTSATVPHTTVSGTGCAVASQPTSSATTIYANLLRLTSELDNYATATDACKHQVVKAVRDTVGPENPSTERCTRTSLTCALFTSNKAVNVVLAKMLEDGEKLVHSLQPELMTGVSSAFNTLSARVDDVAAATKALGTAIPGSTVAQQIVTLNKSLDTLDTETTTLDTGFTTIANTAKTATAELGTVTTPGSMAAQNEELAQRLCTLLPGMTSTPSASLLPGEALLSEKSVEQLRSYLTDKSCQGKSQLTPPPGYQAPMATRLAAQATAWGAVTTTAGPDGAGKAIAALRVSAANLRTTLATIGTNSGTQDTQKSALITSLNQQVEALTAQRKELGTRTAALEAQQEALTPAVQKAFASADAAASAAITAALDEQARRVSEQSKDDVAEISAMFDRSVSGLRQTADKITSDGANTVNKEHADLDKAEKRISTAVSEQTQASLATIDTTIGASTRDTDAASALLVADLHKVLLDLGDRSTNGSGLLGSMTTSAAKVGAADVQLALASQSAQGYSNVRSEDIAGILLAQAQSRASLTAGAALPAFHLGTPSGVQTQTVYSFRIGGQS